MKKNNKIERTLDFIEYISKGMEKEDLFLLYRINNITKERLELFHDFINYLNELIVTTYMGDDITVGEDKNKHFDWCWSKVIDSFKEEEIYFLYDSDLYNYLNIFYKESFYEENNKETKNISSLSDFWEKLFSYKNIKTMSEYESLLELYKIFNKSFIVN